MIKTKKVLLIDHSPFMKKIIIEILKSSDKLEVLETIGFEEQYLKKIEKLKPDLLLFHIETGFEEKVPFIKKMIKLNSIPLIIVSNFIEISPDKMSLVLEHNLIDFIVKPNNIVDLYKKEMRDYIIDIVLNVANIKPSLSLPLNRTIKSFDTHLSEKLGKIIAIGISTGGPRALQDVIPRLPKDFPAGIVIVQHMPPGFTKSLAERLNNLSKITVKEAEEGDIIKAGVVYIAPGGDKHLTIVKKDSNYCIKLFSSPPVGGHRPAVNVLMNSLLDIDIEVIGVIMTGMGADGLEGLKALKEKKKIKIIAQNEETCVVYGMPKAVVQAGIADEVVPLQQISEKLINMAGGY